MNTTPKRYELLKDICGPIWNFKAGSIFEKFGLSADSAYTCLNLCLHPDYVEKKPEWFREIKENKEWEIVQYEKGGFIHSPVPNGDCERENCKIYSVKRLSDGDVFSVGDKVGSSWGKQKIEKFAKYDDGSMVAEFSTCRNQLSLLSKWEEKQFGVWSRDGVTFMSKSEFEEAERKAFEAAREVEKWNHDILPSLTLKKYPKFEDYKKSKQQ